METAITYRLEVGDLITVYRYLHRTNRFSQTLHLGVCTLLTVMTIHSVLQAKEALWLKVVAGILAWGLVIAAYQGLVWGITWFNIRVNLPKDETSGVLGDHTLRITPTQLIESTTVNQTFHEWIGVQRLQELPEHLLIVFKNHHVHIIPKKAFATSGDYQGFYTVLQESWQQSQPNAKLQ